MANRTPNIRVENLARSLPGRQRLRTTELSNAKLMRLLYSGPHTLDELVEESGISYVTVRCYVAALRREKLVRLVDKAPDILGYKRIPIFQWDPDKPDVKVRAKTKAELQRAYRERKDAQRLNEAFNAMASVGRVP